VSVWIGQLAALGTALCWTLSATAFTHAGRRVGSISVNIIRLAMALVILAGARACASGAGWGGLGDASVWLWLGLSGFIGFFLADLCLFRAFLDIGPRRTLLTLSLAPPVSALIGAVWLGERLSGGQWLGMAVTLSGVVWGVWESGEPGTAPAGAAASRPRGIALAVVGMLAQAVSMVVAKRGLAAPVTAIEATLIRVVAGLAGFVIMVTAARRWPRVAAALRDRVAVSVLAAGALIGPVLGVVLMMISLERIPTGVAQTFVATTPIMIIPFAAALHQDRVTPARLAAALLALSGVALLFLV
jgi:drug/metabolite transporter (DMT)-like permease